MPHKDLALLLRLNKSWYDGIAAAELYEITRAWWVMSSANAQRVSRILAVAGGVVREVYEPTEWLQSPIEGLENRIGFHGVVAPDRDTYLGSDVSHLFRQGSANPVRYLAIDKVLDSISTPTDRPPGSRPDVEAALEPVEPGLLERILPLLDAFEHDRLWHQSRAGQELFHSNTIAWLLKHFPAETAPLLSVLGGAGYDPERIDVWRERRNLDIVIDPVGAVPKIVVENKLYSVPYPAQLLKYNAYALPWSSDHGAAGAADTRYVLLSLMKPSFPLPEPWSHAGYQQLAEALDVMDADSFGRSAEQFVRYRGLLPTTPATRSEPAQESPSARGSPVTRSSSATRCRPAAPRRDLRRRRPDRPGAPDRRCRPLGDGRSVLGRDHDGSADRLTAVGVPETGRQKKLAQNLLTTRRTCLTL